MTVVETAEQNADPCEGRTAPFIGRLVAIGPVPKQAPFLFPVCDYLGSLRATSFVHLVVGTRASHRVLRWSVPAQSSAYRFLRAAIIQVAKGGISRCGVSLCGGPCCAYIARREWINEHVCCAHVLRSESHSKQPVRSSRAHLEAVEASGSSRGCLGCFLPSSALVWA